MSIFLTILILILVISIIKRQEKEESLMTTIQRDSLYKSEKERRLKIISNLVNFLNQAKGVKPFAKLGDEKVYTYIVEDNTIYEFSEFLLDSEKMEFDDNWLLFNRCAYKRVPIERLETVKQNIIEKNYLKQKIKFNLHEN